MMKHEQESFHEQYTSEKMRADLKREAVAVTDWLNRNGGYQRGKVDPVEITKGGPGNCFGATVLIVEEMKKHLSDVGEPNRAQFFLGFPTDHGVVQRDGKEKTAHTTLFVVDTLDKTVIEANIMAYENIPPTVMVEGELTSTLRSLDTSDLTVLNADPNFRETYSVQKEGEQSVEFTVYGYEEGIEAYLEGLGQQGLFSLDQVRDALTSTRHLIPDGLVHNPQVPIDQHSGLPLPTEENF